MMVIFQMLDHSFVWSKPEECHNENSESLGEDASLAKPIWEKSIEEEEVLYNCE